MLNFDEFKEKIVSDIRRYLPKEFHDSDITLALIHKNNVTLDALIIRNDSSVATPTICLNSMYESYRNGQSFDSILADIADIRINAEQDIGTDINAELLTDFEQVKDNIVCHLIGVENNEAYLAERPYTQIEDLAATYHIQIDTDQYSNMSIPISNELFHLYDVDVTDLHQIAVSNMEHFETPLFKSLRDTLIELMHVNLMNTAQLSEEDAMFYADTLVPEDEITMYVLSNETKMHGAAMILNDNIRQNIAEQLGSDFFVLPSSIHELLIIPKTEDVNFRDLEALVYEVNSSEVAPADRLSNHVYEYDAKENEFFRSDRAEERQAEKDKANTKAAKKSVRAKLNTVKEKSTSAPHPSPAPHKKDPVLS